MNVALLGGSFDPVHNGHLTLARAVLAQCDTYTQIVYMPAWHAPMRPTPPHASARHRLRMLRLALKGCNRADRAAFHADSGTLSKRKPRYVADRWEIRHTQRGYTIDTVEHLRRAYRTRTHSPSIGLIIGEDLVEELPRWHRSDELAVDLLIARRPPSEAQSAAPSAPEPSKANLNLNPNIDDSLIAALKMRMPSLRSVQIVDNPLVSMASSTIRTLIKNGKSIEGMVPNVVAQYITKHRLYRN